MPIRVYSEAVGLEECFVEVSERWAVWKEEKSRLAKKGRGARGEGEEELSMGNG